MILSLDQGTTGSTALLMDLKGNVIGSHNETFPQIFPQPGWVEHAPYDILKSVKKAITEVFATTKKKPEDVLTIGITNQRETVVFWDGKTGKPYGNALVWQCRRTAKRTEQIKKNHDDVWIKKKTGLSVDPYFSSTKIEWFLKNHKNSPNLRVGTIDSFLLYHLSGKKVFSTEHSNASRTQLYNLKKGGWDPELLKFFKVKEEFLPEIMDSDETFGVVNGFSPLIDGTPITGILGDQQSALFGQGAFDPGDLKCTFGTGSFVLLNTGEKIRHSKNGLLSTVAWKLKNKKINYALEGGAFNCSSCINWFKDELGVLEKSSDIGPKAVSVPSSEGVLFAPTFSGLGAPYWKPEARGAFVGLTRGSSGAHLSRALLEGLSFQNKLIFKAMQKDFGSKLKSVYVDGGASQSNEFMQIQADLSGELLKRPKSIETTAMGAAFVAGVGAGVLKQDIKKLNPVEAKFKPQKQKASDLKKLLSDYEGLFKALCSRPF